MLRSLRLTRFKSFEEATLPFGPLTLLVGTNASGKSNVRDALRFLFGCAQGYSITEVAEGKWGDGGVRLWQGVRGGLKELSWRGSTSFQVEAELEIEDSPPLRYTLLVSLSSEPGESARVSAEALYAGGSRVFDTKPTNASLEQEGPAPFLVCVGAGGEAAGEGPPKRYDPTRTALTQVAEDLSVDAGSREVAARARQHLRGIRFLDLEPEAMREPVHPSFHDLGDRGENLSAVLQHIYRDGLGRTVLLEWLRALTPLDVVDLEFLEDLRGRILVQLVEENGDRISAASASDGTLRFLALVATLLDSSHGWINFYEEIDSGIHPTRLHLLIDLFERRQQFQVLPRQFLATSHNPLLLRFLSEETRNDALLIYRLAGAASSQAVRILDIPGLREALSHEDLGRLYSIGFLEDAVELLAAEGPSPGGATISPTLAGVDT